MRLGGDPAYARLGTSCIGVPAGLPFRRLVSSGEGAHSSLRGASVDLYQSPAVACFLWEQISDLSEQSTLPSLRHVDRVGAYR